MPNSGPNGEWKDGSWTPSLPPSTPLLALRVWCWEGGGVTVYDDWSDVPDAVLLVAAFHLNSHNGATVVTRMNGCDGYPHPTGRGPKRLGVQVGEVGSATWRDVKARVLGEVEARRQELSP